jgi:sigma-B regulation protein RsbQ
MTKNIITKDYLKWGNGEVVFVMLHYFGGNASCWKWVGKLFPKDIMCVAINLPGFGNTKPLKNSSIKKYANHVTQILKKLNITKYILVGHSMGGKIAIQLAADDSNKNIQQMFLIAPSPPDQEIMNKRDEKELLKYPTKKEAAATVKKLHVKTITKKQMKTAVDAQLQTCKAVRNWWINKGSKESITNIVSNIKCKVTIIAAENDPAISFKNIKEMRKNYFKNSKLIIAKNVGHLYPLEVARWMKDQLILTK